MQTLHYPAADWAELGDLGRQELEYSVAGRPKRNREPPHRKGHAPGPPIKACSVLSVFLGYDHCQFAMQPGSLATEVWAWSENFSQPDLTPEAAAASVPIPPLEKAAE
jgi:hypothetical protein